MVSRVQFQVFALLLWQTMTSWSSFHAHKGMVMQEEVLTPQLHQREIVILQHAKTLHNCGLTIMATVWQRLTYGCDDDRLSLTFMHSVCLECCTIIAGKMHNLKFI